MFRRTMRPKTRKQKARQTRLFLSHQTQWKYATFLVLVAPAIFLRLLTAAYPIGTSLYLSFTNLNLISGTNRFVGWRNYPLMLYNFGVQSAISYTIIFVIASTILELAFGLGIALLLNATFRGRQFARMINLIPWAIPTIVAAYAFRWLLDDQFGPLSHWAYLVSGERVVPLISPFGARLSLILVNVWKNAPFMAVVFLAALQGVPEELYEAARVDGATSWRRFRSITLPMMRPLMVTMGVFFLVFQLASFDLIYGLTSGGPGVATSVLALRIYQEGLLFFKFGFASAISMVLLVLVAVVGIIGLALFRRFDVSA